MPPQEWLLAAPSLDAFVGRLRSSRAQRAHVHMCAEPSRMRHAPSRTVASALSDLARIVAIIESVAGAGGTGNNGSVMVGSGEDAANALRDTLWVVARLSPSHRAEPFIDRIAMDADARMASHFGPIDVSSAANVFTSLGYRFHRLLDSIAGTSEHRLRDLVQSWIILTMDIQLRHGGMEDADADTSKKRPGAPLRRSDHGTGGDGWDAAEEAAAAGGATEGGGLRRAGSTKGGNTSHAPPRPQPAARGSGGMIGQFRRRRIGRCLTEVRLCVEHGLVHARAEGQTAPGGEGFARRS